jgi:hypothetical protein
MDRGVFLYGKVYFSSILGAITAGKPLLGFPIRQIRYLFLFQLGLGLVILNRVQNNVF